MGRGIWKISFRCYFTSGTHKETFSQLFQLEHVEKTRHFLPQIDLKVASSCVVSGLLILKCSYGLVLSHSPYIHIYTRIQIPMSYIVIFSLNTVSVILMFDEYK